MTGTTNPTIAETGQSLSPGNRVYLFVLDLNPLKMDPTLLPAGGKLYFSPSAIGSAEIVFQGNTYQSAPIEATGFEVTGTGQLPQPTLRLANISNLAGSLAAAYGDLVGATLTRYVTFRHFLDDAATADRDAVYPPTVWEVIQKSKQNKLYIEWTLASFLDRDGDMIPKRTVWKHVCTWPYRAIDPLTGDFDYSLVQGCSWAGATYYDVNGAVVTDKADDVCGKRVADCKTRFGANAELPFGGFLGVNDQ